MERTVLILGAGFSHPYKYPLGSKLVSDIITEGLRSNNSSDKILAEQLRDYGASSIDRFLADHPDHLKRGKLKIAKAIQAAEEKSLFSEVQPNKDVVNLLLKEIEPEEFENLRIISFNYDRLLEFKFLKKLRTRHSFEEANLLFSKIKIRHIHERLPPLRDLEVKTSEQNAFRYGAEDASQEHKYWIDDVIHHHADSLNTIFTADKKPEPFAIEAIKWAERVFFLGFAFDELNMKKLGINVEGIIYDWPAKIVAGTAYGLTPVQKNKIKLAYPFLNQSLIEVTARELFEKHYSLENSDADEEKSPRRQKRTCCQSHAIQEMPPPRVPNLAEFPFAHTCKICEKQFSVRYHKPQGSGKWLVRT